MVALQSPFLYMIMIKQKSNGWYLHVGKLEALVI